MSMKTMVAILTGVMLATVMTMSLASAKDVNCKAMCESSLKCPNAEKGTTVKECVKGCKAMKENLRKELSEAILGCAEANMCKGPDASDECMKKAMAAAMMKQSAPVPGADTLPKIYCDKMMECMSKSGAVPPAQLATVKGQCLQNMAMSGMDKMLSKKGVKRFKACLTKSTCENLGACMADVFGASPEKK